MIVMSFARDSPNFGNVFLESQGHALMTRAVARRIVKDPRTWENLAVGLSFGTCQRLQTLVLFLGYR
jgi:hypothetical protein